MAEPTPLTADEIRKMPAGREMDALIAQHVFGWRWQRCEYIGPSPVSQPVVRYNLMLPGSEAETWRCTPSDDRTKHKILADYQPTYSTDIEAAWKVAEKFAPYFRLDARGYGEGNWGCTIWTGYAEVHEYGPTAQVAVCRAALIAIATFPTEVPCASR